MRTRDEIEREIILTHQKEIIAELVRTMRELRYRRENLVTADDLTEKEKERAELLFMALHSYIFRAVRYYYSLYWNDGVRLGHDNNSGYVLSSGWVRHLHHNYQTNLQGAIEVIVPDDDVTPGELVRALRKIIGFIEKDYPRRCDLPSVVSETTAQLLAHLQAVLEAKAPVVAKSLQPGLSDARIAELEARGGFRLSDDLRALYRWHDGMPADSTVGLLPGERFVPLAEVVDEVVAEHQQSGESSRAFGGDRNGWLRILDDGFGDGYFYDPERTDPQGAFFLHLGPVGRYVWFPSLRNFLSGVIECYQTQAVKIATDGKSLRDGIYSDTEEIWSRLGKVGYRDLGRDDSWPLGRQETDVEKKDRA